MRVKLSYTVSAEDVLKEAAKLIGLQAEDMQRAVTLYQEVQQELHGGADSENSVVNIHRAQEMVAEFREALFSVDRRLGEVAEIINGYDDYLRTARDTTDVPDVHSSPTEEAPTAEAADIVEEPELFGAD